MGKNIPLGPPSKGEYVVLPPSTRSFAGETPALRFPLLKGVARRAGGCNHPAPPSFSGLSCGKHTLAPYPATIKGANMITGAHTGIHNEMPRLALCTWIPAFGDEA